MAADFLEIDGLKFSVNGPNELSRDGDVLWLDPTGLLIQSGGINKKFIDALYAGAAVSNEAELNTAITALPSGGIIIIKNSFSITTSKTFPNLITLLGRGYNTEITLTSGSTINVGSDSSIRDLGIKTTNTTGSLINISGSRSVIEGVKIIVTNSNNVTAINVGGNYNSIYRCIFVGVVGAGPAIGINYSAGTGHIDRHCAFL